MAYRADTRSAAAVLADLARAAGRSPLPPSLAAAGKTWADLLFAPASAELADRTEASQTLLAALAALHAGRAGLVEHFDTLPGEARRWYAQARLGIQPLPTEPDRVVLVVDGDPKRAPELLPKGAAVKAGVNAAGGERIYETAEALTVLGLPVLGAKTWFVPTSGADRVQVVEPAVDPAPEPFAAFGAEAAGAVATHALYVASDLLALGSGTYKVAVSFDGIAVGGVAPTDAKVAKKLFAALVWELSGPKGYAAVTPTVQTNGPTSATLTFAVTAPTAPLPIGTTSAYHLRGRFDEASTTFPRQQALGLSFTDARIKITASGVQPDNGFFDDGVLDVTKEFKPFGPVPRAGDSFGLRSDSAFSKPLEHLTVAFDFAAALPKKPKVEWQRFHGGTWQHFDTTSLEKEKAYDDDVPVHDPFSERASLGGLEGHSLRIVLVTDFGWDDYEKLLASIVNHFVSSNPPTVTVTAPPKPPRFSSATIGYRTKEQSLKAHPEHLQLYAVNGPSGAIPLPAGTRIVPFRLDPSGRRGALYVGFGAAPEGEAVALYVEIDEQSACDVVQAQPNVEWRYASTGGTWATLGVVDRTAELRQSGIVRFAVPDDWRAGSDDVGEAAGYWIQATSEAPELAGRIRRLRTDAVEAVYRLGPDRARDTTPTTPLAPGTAKQLKLAVPGIKKVVNPGESWGGRGPEPPAAFARRTSRRLRHRNRAITPWDVEALVTETFPDVGLVRCLPHHSRDSECAPGWFAVVVVPRSLERLPRPSVRLAGLVEEFLHEHATGGVRLAGESHIAVLCPEYEEALVSAKLVLERGVEGGEARRDIEAALAEWLRPLGSNPERSEFGRTLFLSSVVWFLENRPEVAYVESCAFGGDHVGAERIDVDGCRGLIASAAAHDLHVRPQL
jgi:Baseplate J-like protein